MVVGVDVGIGVGVSVGSGVSVGGCSGVRALAVPVPERFAAATVSAMAVGRYSGGSGVGTGLELGEAQPAKIPRRQASRESL